MSSDEEIMNLSAHNELRLYRNKALSETDKYMIADYPISNENKQIMLTYRQTLRDLPSTFTGQTLDFSQVRFLIPPNPFELPV
jgi:hypothetical protein